MLNCRLSPPTNSEFLLKLTWILLPAILLVPPGCDDTQTSEAQSSRHQANDLARELEAEQRNHQRALDRLSIEKEQIREDARAMDSIMVSCGIAIVLLILILARERRCRRILERLLRMLIDRLDGPLRPP